MLVMLIVLRPVAKAEVQLRRPDSVLPVTLIDLSEQYSLYNPITISETRITTSVLTTHTRKFCSCFRISIISAVVVRFN